MRNDIVAWLSLNMALVPRPERSDDHQHWCELRDRPVTETTWSLDFGRNVNHSGKRCGLRDAELSRPIDPQWGRLFVTWVGEEEMVNTT